MSTELFSRVPFNSKQQESETPAPLDIQGSEALVEKSQRVALKSLEEEKESKSFRLLKSIKPLKEKKSKSKIEKTYKAIDTEEETSAGLFGFFKKSLSKRKKRSSNEKPSSSHISKRSFSVPPILIPSKEENQSPKKSPSPISLTPRLTDSESFDLFTLKTDRSDLISKFQALKMSINELNILPEFETIQSRVNKIKKLQENYGFQDPEVSFHTFQTIELAKLLVSEGGQFTPVFIPFIINYFISSTPPLNYEASLYYGLKALIENEELAEVINDIKAPKNQKGAAADLIRICLNLKSSDIVHAKEAKITAISALLSHMRQGELGSCFATHLAISELSNNPLTCAKDFSTLLRKGCLIREVEGVEKTFPFLFRTADQTLRQTIHINAKGELSDKGNSPIWKAPPIAKALRIAGFENSKKAIINALLTLSSNSKHENDELCMHELLETLAKQAHKLPINKGKSLTQIYYRMSFAIETMVCNPLLRVFENSLAEMAESDETGMVTKPVIYSIIKPLQVEIEQYLKNKKKEKKEAKSLYIKFENLLKKRIHLHYDPDVHQRMDVHEHYPQEGGFILYDTHNKPRSSKWTRIDTPEAFQHFVESIVSEVCENEGDKFTLLLKHLKTFINSNFFVLEALNCFYPDNLKFENPRASWRSMTYTPWKIISGNFGERVREIYKQSNHWNEKKIMDPKDAGKFLLDLCVLREKNTFLKTTQKTPVYSKTHAFNLIFDHASFDLLSENIEESIQSMLLKAKELSNEAAKKKSIDCFFEKLKLFFIDPAENEAITALLSDILDPIAYLDLRSMVLKYLQLNNATKHHPNEELIFFIDSALFESFSDTILQIIQENSIHIADSNWKQGLQDIHFCIAPHPGTGTLSFFEIQDNGTKIAPIHDLWLLEKPWEFYYSPRL